MSFELFLIMFSAVATVIAFAGGMYIGRRDEAEKWRKFAETVGFIKSAGHLYKVEKQPTPGPSA